MLLRFNNNIGFAQLNIALGVKKNATLPAETALGSVTNVYDLQPLTSPGQNIGHFTLQVFPRSSRRAVKRSESESFWSLRNQTETV